LKDRPATRDPKIQSKKLFGATCTILYYHDPQTRMSRRDQRVADRDSSPRPHDPETTPMALGNIENIIVLTVTTLVNRPATVTCHVLLWERYPLSVE
jgi:hypothetical protein